MLEEEPDEGIFFVIVNGVMMFHMRPVKNALPSFFYESGDLIISSPLWRKEEKTREDFPTLSGELIKEQKNNLSTWQEYPRILQLKKPAGFP